MPRRHVLDVESLRPLRSRRGQGHRRRLAARHRVQHRWALLLSAGRCLDLVPAQRHQVLPRRVPRARLGKGMSLQEDGAGGGRLVATVQTDQVTLTIDGQSVTVPKGTLILDAAKSIGIDIPIFCSHPKMAPVAVCRMCLVEVEKMPKLQPACAVYVAEGMVIKTTTEQVGKYQKGVLEFLLINHPLDCPICDKGGECPLQDQTFQYGPGASRFDFQKAHFDKAVPLSDKIVLDRERCILCWRCTRFSEEISGERELALIQRGVHTITGTFNDEPAQSNYQGNWTEICPVGALTSRQYRFVSRPWDLDRTASVCPGCSMGCNIQLDARNNRIGRFQSRENLAVDDGWLCDAGRYSFPQFQRTAQDRPQIRRGGTLERVTYDEVVAFTADALKASGQVAGWASPAASNEELFLFQRLFREVLASPNIDHRSAVLEDAEPDDMTLPILPHRGPGYVALNGTSGKGRVEWPGAGVKALYVHESSPLHGFVPTDAESMWLSGLPLVIVHRFKPSPLDGLAHVIIPGHAFTEKDGTVTNMEGRVQRIRKGIDAAWVREDWRVLQEIANHLGANWD